MASEERFERPVIGKGLLPVTVLVPYIFGWLERQWPELNEEMREQILFQGLKPGIAYHIDATRIVDSAEIDSKRKIHLWENFLQLLWCVCYAQVVCYQEGWQKSVRSGDPRGYYDSSDPEIARAYKVLDAGVSLLDHFDASVFDPLPMPAEPVNEGDELVGKASNVLIAAGVFIVIHEYAHHWYDHVSLETDKAESQSFEYAADSLALDFLKRGTGKGRDVDNIHALGVVATMTTLMLINPGLEGGDAHPDLHERYWHALNRLSLDGAQDIWVNACISLQMWGRYNPVPVEIKDPMVPRDGSQAFREILDQIVSHQRSMYPT